MKSFSINLLACVLGIVIRAVVATTLEFLAMDFSSTVILGSLLAFPGDSYLVAIVFMNIVSMWLGYKVALWVCKKNINDRGALSFTIVNFIQAIVSMLYSLALYRISLSSGAAIVVMFFAYMLMRHQTNVMPDKASS